MDMEQRLKDTIAELLNISVNEIIPELSLDIPKFRSSAGRTILRLAIRKRLGKDIDAKGVKTFAELLSRVDGKDLLSEDKTAPENAATSAISREGAGLVGNSAGFISCGVDIEDIAIFPDTDDYWSHEFYESNFTAEEIAYCVSKTSPREHFAARWCAKEALKKVSSRYMSLNFSQMCTIKQVDGSVSMQVHNIAGWEDIPGSVSLSHTDKVAIAFVVINTGFLSGPSVLSA